MARRAATSYCPPSRNREFRSRIIKMFGVQPLPVRKKAQIVAMKKVELSDEAFSAPERLAAAQNPSPGELITALIGADRLPLAGDHLLFFLTRAEFLALADPAARYLGLLSWIAQNYASDFADFISHQGSGRRYLMLSREEVNAVRSHNHAVQLDGTQYWAVMTIDDTTKRRFVCRLLEFIGCRDETVAQACRSLGLGEVHTGFRVLCA